MVSICAPWPASTRRPMARKQLSGPRPVYAGGEVVVEVHLVDAGVLQGRRATGPATASEKNGSENRPDRPTAVGPVFAPASRVTLASTVSRSRFSSPRRSPGGTRSAMRASIRRSASTSASAQSRSIVVVVGRIVRVCRQASTNLRARSSFDRASGASSRSRFTRRVVREGQKSVQTGAARLGKMLVPGLGPHRVVGQFVPVEVELAADEIHHRRRNELARSQQATPGSGARTDCSAKPSLLRGRRRASMCCRSSSLGV